MKKYGQRFSSDRGRRQELLGILKNGISLGELKASRLSSVRRLKIPWR